MGSSRTSSSGSPTRAAASETRERWPPERRPTSDVGVAREVDRLDGLARRPTRGAEDAGEVADVGAHGEVVVDARALGDVADPVAQGGDAGGLAEHGDRRPTRRPAPRRPPGSGWTCRCRSGPSRPDDLARRDRTVRSGSTSRPPRTTRSVLDLDGVIHHVMKYTSGHGRRTRAFSRRRAREQPKERVGSVRRVHGALTGQGSAGSWGRPARPARRASASTTAGNSTM